MRLFDSHCHLEDKRFGAELPQIIQNMHARGIERCILAGSNPADCLSILSLTEQYPELLWAVVGYHPQDVKEWSDASEGLLTEWLKDKNVIGIGEIGLDYHYGLEERDLQIEVFLKQLDLAHRLGKPAVLHIREAHGDVLQLMKERKNTLPACVLHCYSGSVETAKEYLKLGFMISFAGTITFKNAAKLPEVAKICPLDRFLIETDSPYLAPVPMRGRRNEPANVYYVAEKLAEIWGIPTETVAEASWNNTCRFYGLENEA